MKSALRPTPGEQDKESVHEENQNGKAGSPLGSPVSRSGTESQPQDFHDAPFREGINVDGSPRATEKHKLVHILLYCFSFS